MIALPPGCKKPNGLRVSVLFFNNQDSVIFSLEVIPGIWSTPKQLFVLFCVLFFSPSVFYYCIASLGYSLLSSSEIRAAYTSSSFVVWPLPPSLSLCDIWFRVDSPPTYLTPTAPYRPFSTYPFFPFILREVGHTDVSSCHLSKVLPLSPHTRCVPFILMYFFCIPFTLPSTALHYTTLPSTETPPLPPSLSTSPTIALSF